MQRLWGDYASGKVYQIVKTGGYHTINTLGSGFNRPFGMPSTRLNRAQPRSPRATGRPVRLRPPNGKSSYAERFSQQRMLGSLEVST